MADQIAPNSGYFGSDFLDELTQRINGPAFLGRFLKIQARGNRHYAVCPFHKDSKPSFLIRDDGSFYCFGCQKKGTVFNFLMDRNGLSFPEAVKEVAQFVGMPLPTQQGRKGPSKEQQVLYEVLENSAAFFEQLLQQATINSPIKRYLANRGIDEAAIATFRIGYAPDDWTTLKDRFSSVDPQLLIDAGVLTRHPERNSTYDLFRNRLMFPIRNRQGRVVGFGGRTLDNHTEPKYLNTKQTKVFSKSHELYGLFEALQITRRPSRLLLVEGYMDVIALSQQDISYAVATLGTASNENHFRTLFWFTDEVICCFDGDEAGRHAAERSLEATLAALTEEKSVRFVLLPEGEDPDSFIRKHGREAFTKLIDDAQHVADYFVNTLVESKDQAFQSIEKKARFVNRAKKFIQTVRQESMRQILAQEIAKLMPDEEAIEQLLMPVSSVPEEPPPSDDPLENQLADEPELEPKKRYNDVATRRRISQLLCASTIWPDLSAHRDLLDQLVELAQDHPLTRLWLMIDQYKCSSATSLIASFQDDKAFSLDLTDIYDADFEPAMSGPETLTQLIEDFHVLLTSRKIDIARKAKLEQMTRHQDR